MNRYTPKANTQKVMIFHKIMTLFKYFYRFKDNRPYPWPGDVSSFILNPESANQTIYTRSLTSSDHGVYTCQLANQTNIVNHSMKLVTFG